MSIRKHKRPRVRCECDKVIAEHGRSRTPSPQQQREIDAAQGLERGRLVYRYSGGMNDRFSYEVLADGSAYLYCSRCSIRYQPANYIDRVYSAHERGEDLVLLRTDRRRDT